MAELILYCTVEGKPIARLVGTAGARVRKAELIDGLQLYADDPEAEARLIGTATNGEMLLCPYCSNPLSLATESTSTNELKRSPITVPLGSFRFPS